MATPNAYLHLGLVPPAGEARVSAATPDLFGAE